MTKHEPLPENPPEPKPKRIPKKPGQPNYRKWPKLTESEQKTIQRFLAWYQMQAMKAAEKAAQMYALSNADPSFAPMMHYWQACVKCLNWLNQRTTVRQEYLTLPDPTTEGEDE